MRTEAKSQPILVKRYARSRLYDTTNCRYVSIQQLRAWVAAGVAFSVIDMACAKIVLAAQKK